MTWHWRKSAACDLDELLDDINPQMKDLEGELVNRRPAIMAGYPDAVGVITLPTAVSHTGDLVETTLKTTDFGRGALGSKAGFRIRASGTRTGTASTINIKLKWGGETICTLNVAAADGATWSIVAEFWNVDSTQNQTYVVQAWDALAHEIHTASTISVDTL